MVTRTPRLSVEDVSYGYRGHIVGRSCRLCGVAAGEVLCVLGRDGEGKSTLFKTVLGLVPPLAGTVRVDGEPISGWNAATSGANLRLRPAERRWRLSVYRARDRTDGANRTYGPFSAPSSADRDAADEAIATLGIDHLAEREWLRVSGGERQLALVARALAQEPRILVLDEPTASLDFGNQLRVLDAVRRLAGNRALSRVVVYPSPRASFQLRRSGRGPGRRRIAAARQSGRDRRRRDAARVLLGRCRGAAGRRWPLPRLRAALLSRLRTAVGLLGCEAPRLLDVELGEDLWRRHRQVAPAGRRSRHRSRWRPRPAAARSAPRRRRARRTDGAGSAPRPGSCRSSAGRRRPASGSRGSRILDAPLLVVDVLLVERPADALGATPPWIWPST